MKTKGLLALGAALFAALVSTNSLAQNPTGTVEVKKDYQTDLSGARKGALKVDFSDTLKKFDLNMDYKIQDRQLRDLYSFTPMPSAKISSQRKEEIPSFFAKAGISFPTAPSLALWYQPALETGEDFLTLKASHDSFHSKAKIADVNASDKVIATSDKIQAKQWKNTLGASYIHLWKEAQLNADLAYRNGHQSYYGVDLAKYKEAGLLPDFAGLRSKEYMKHNLSSDYNQFEFGLGASSIQTDDYSGKFHYDGRFSFTSTSDKGKFGTAMTLRENLLNASLEFGPTVGKYSMVTAGVSSQTAFYSNAQDYHLSLLDATLTYRLRRDRLSMDLGARVSFPFTNKSGADKYHNYVSPKVSITYKMEDNQTWAYAIADGGNVINSFASLLERAPYVSPIIDLRESGTPVYAKAGIKGMASKEVDFDVYAGGAWRKGMLQFSGNPLNAVYSNHAEAFIGAKLNYKTPGFAAGADAKYSFYTKGKNYNGAIQGLDGLPIAVPAPGDYAVKGKPAGYPPFEANIYAEANINEKLFIGATLYGRSATPASVFLYNGSKIKYKGYADLGLYAQYVIDNHFTAYINGGNLLNADRINYGMYVERGINIGFGLLIKF
mgnify:FL=1